MRAFISSVVVAVTILGCNELTPQSIPSKVLAEFPGASLKWVHAAEPEFQRNNLDLNDYTVSVIEQQKSVTVILNSSGASKEVRGSMATHQGYEVEISKKDLTIVRANYVR